MGIEFELKYKGTPELHRALLEAHPGKHQKIAMQTTYFDTPERTLSARRWTLRRRLENGISICTVKVPAGDQAKGEWECPMEDISSAIPELCKLGAPKELISLTAAGLEPICGARFTRLAVPVEAPEFTAELALDTGVLSGGSREEELCEVELELKSGSKEAMIAYARVLVARFGLEIEKYSKFRRAKALAEGE